MNNVFKILKSKLPLISILLLLFGFQPVFATPTTPPSDFIDNNDGTVTHKTTGLTWMRCAVGQTWTGSSCSGFEAYFYSGISVAYDFAGHNDWRLPNITELQTIVELENYYPSINNTIFPNTHGVKFLSSSFVAGTTKNSWYVNFADGNTTQSSLYILFAVRLVRADQPLSISTPNTDFSDNQDGTVTHKTTGLTWMRCAVGQTWTGSSCSGTASRYTYDQAIALSNTFFAGHSDWRLPNANELVGIVNYSAVYPSINNTVFPNTPSDLFWSSSGYISDIYAFGVYFNYGYVDIYYRDNSLAVRLVRNGQPPVLLEKNVILLLHGMNSTPNTSWNQFKQQYFGNKCGLIYSGKIKNPSTSNSYGTECYALKFGKYDEQGPNGIENAKQYGKESNIDLAGDFSTLNQLGIEVQKAVSAILTKHQNAHIILLGHSRGGLAARAFLQNPGSSKLKKSIKSLITMGTPHSGSPLGRIYSYLSQNPRPQLILSGDGGKTKRLAADWKIVDFLRGKKSCDKILLDGDKRLDVRRPTLDYIASGSDSMNELNENIGNLPTTVSYGAIVFESNNIGYLGRKSIPLLSEFKYSVFDQSSHLDICTVSLDAQNFILNNKSPDDTDYIGDGIVPSLNQMYNDASTSFIYPDILHTEETNGLDNVNDIFYIKDKFCDLGLSNWITACQ